MSQWLIQWNRLAVWFLGNAVPDESQIPCLPSLPNVSTLSVVLPISSLSFCPFILPHIATFSFLSAHRLPYGFFFFCSLLHLPPTSLSHLSTLFSLSNNNLSSLSLSCSFFLSTHLFFLQEATFIFGLHCSVCICHVLHLPLTDPLETVVVLCV